ncbi:hypothetical protein ACRAKI_19925 [Saccharothrix isguenensis]
MHRRVPGWSSDVEHVIGSADLFEKEADHGPAPAPHRFPHSAGASRGSRVRLVNRDQDDFEDHQDPVFAGDLYLRLAVDGRLVLEPAEADRVIEGLERTLDAITEHLEVIDLLRGTALGDLRRAHPRVERVVVDAVFHEQVTGGRLRRALDELPKYIEAFQRAKRPRTAGDPGPRTPP